MTSQSEYKEQGDGRRAFLLNVIRTYRHVHGFGPSVRELADAVGVKSTAARHHLHVLQREGWVTWTDGKMRSMQVLREGPYQPPED